MKEISIEMLKTLTIDDLIDLYRQGYVLPSNTGTDLIENNIKNENQIDPLIRLTQEDIFKKLKGSIIEICTKKLNKSLSELNKSLSEPETVKILNDTISECLNNPIGIKNEPYMSDEDKAYVILGISPGATNIQIKKRYEELSQEYDPNKALHTTESIKNLASDRFKQISCAFEFLKNKRQ